MAVGQEIQVIYYPIREDMARRAKEMNSFSGYIEGTATAEYRRCVDQAVEAAKHQKEKVDPIYHGKIDALVDTSLSDSGAIYSEKENAKDFDDYLTVLYICGVPDSGSARYAR